VLWDGCSDGESKLFESVQYEAGKVATGAMRGMSRIHKMAKLGREKMNVRRDIHKLICYFKIVNYLNPSYLKDLLPSRVCERIYFPHSSSQNFSPFPGSTELFKGLSFFFSLS